MPQGGHWPDTQSFIDDHFIPNKPILLSADCTRNWGALRYWVTDDKQLNISYLRQHFGHLTVDVADCQRRAYDDMPKTAMTMNAFLDYWQNRNDNPECPTWYLKDWHMVRDCPALSADLYQPAPFFQSPLFDYMNFYWEHGCTGRSDDYKFVYMGVKNSWTPLHADVFRSYSWSTNILGTKKWILIPPEKAHLVQGAFDLNGIDLEGIQPLVIYQRAGETLFVPSNWFHQVHNETDCVSINHNFANAFNLKYLYGALVQSHGQCEEAISHLKSDMDDEEWKMEVEKLLQAHHGMNWGEFAEMLEMVKRELLQANTTTLDELHVGQQTLREFSLLEIEKYLDMPYLSQFTHH